LRDYLIKGYVVNEKIRRNQIGELRQLVQMVGRISLVPQQQWYSLS